MDSMTIHVDRRDTQPLFRQIVSQVERAVAEGVLSPGARLPTSRGLANRLRVNRLTVSRAYAEMAASGLIESHVGRGTFIRSGATTVSRAGSGWNGSDTDHPVERFAWASLFARSGIRPADLRLPAGASAPGIISFSSQFPDAGLFPVEPLRRAIDSVLRHEGAKVLSYGPPAGYLPLRRQIASDLRDRGMRTLDEEVVITSGSQQGIDLVARALLDPGDTVLVENPTYTGAVSVFEACGARLAGVPVDRDGIIPAAFQEVVARHRPKLAYLMPNFQNPTGCTLSLARRRAVVDIAVNNGLAILEDDFGGELRFEGRHLPALKALDPVSGGGHVIYMSTCAKKLLPGLRIGWLAAPKEMADRLARFKQIADYSTSMLLQAAFHEFCRNGAMADHLQTVKENYRRRRDTMLSAMKRCFPAGVRWTKPEGGLLIWVELPEGTSADVVAREAGARGVIVSPGDLFFVDGGTGRHLRLTFAQSGEKEISQGIRILGDAIRKSGRGKSAGVAENTEPLPII